MNRVIKNITVEFANGDTASLADVSEKTDLLGVSLEAQEIVEKFIVSKMLEETDWNRKKAARQLGICYKALLNKLKRWRMDNRMSLPQPSNHL